MTSDERFTQLLNQFAVDLMQEDLDHNCWVVFVWSKGKNEGGPPEVAHGPFASAHEAMAKAEALHQQMAGAEGRHTFMAGYTPTISVVPVYDEADDD